MERSPEYSSLVRVITFFPSLKSDNLTVPNPVLGGVTTFLFASVAVCHLNPDLKSSNLAHDSAILYKVSGARVLGFAKYTRRDRFVLAAALSVGLGDLLVPGIFTHLFDRVNNPSSALSGFLSSITIILSTPCAFVFYVYSSYAYPHTQSLWPESSASS